MTTRIEWATETWNPTTGCTKVSDGCLNCYITATVPFRTARRRFDRPGIGGSTDVQIHPARLLKPFTWTKPERAFVNSLSDLMHDAVELEFIAQVFAAMSLASQHTFLLLTKRAGRLRSLLNSSRFALAWRQARAELAQHPQVLRAAERGRADLDSEAQWPLPNLWVGVSVESQQAADLRIPALRATPAAIRWLSCEPLVGPVDVRQHLTPGGVDWIVVGGESGRGARRMAPSWAKGLLDQAGAAGVPLFYKQTGAVLAAEWGCRDPKGGDPAEWPERFPREFPVEHGRGPADTPPSSRRPRGVRVAGDLFHGQVPAGAVYVGRAAPGLARSPYANPFRASESTLEARADAVDRYRAWIQHPSQRELLAAAHASLAGRDLACWCPLAGPCHRDVLLELVNTSG
jgi:protein gp37